MSKADELLNTVMPANEEPNTDDSIILTVDEDARTLIYTGKSLILGVESDVQAEIVKFKLPRYVGRADVFDISNDDVTVYIDYQNANYEPYIEQCDNKTLQDDGTVLCTWLLSNRVTEAAGTVKFRVCAKKYAPETSHVSYGVNITSDNNDGTGTVATYTVPDNISNYTFDKAVAYFYVKPVGKAEYAPLGNYSGEYMAFDIYKDSESNKVVEKVGVSGNSLELSASELAKLQGAKKIYIKCNQSAVVGTSELNSKYYQVKLELYLSGTKTTTVVVNEWHTALTEAKVLTGIDVSDKTIEVIASEESSIHILSQALSDLSQKIDDAVVTYSKSQIDTKIASLENRLTAVNNPLVVSEASWANWARYDGEGYNISTTYVKEIDLDYKLNQDATFHINNYHDCTETVLTVGSHIKETPSVSQDYAGITQQYMFNYGSSGPISKYDLIKILTQSTKIIVETKDVYEGMPSMENIYLTEMNVTGLRCTYESDDDYVDSNTLGASYSCFPFNKDDRSYNKKISIITMCGSFSGVRTYGDDYAINAFNIVINNNTNSIYITLHSDKMPYSDDGSVTNPNNQKLLSIILVRPAHLKDII